MSIKNEIKDLKKEINALLTKASCKSCGKTLFMFDDNYIYIKCKHCKEVHQFLLDKKVV